ncbi:terpene cyclase/mutase family protein [Thermomicrobiaceae bacterium CFH 74404]|uniref:Terpene cyclase/mutase family protein n=1 Tax=Thermalbibacter longus TaxID=2951981 RepID=A0AA42BAL1_9BACT|nr:terpene cyclase/mutase family protein [Thermalbibacter longus]MCM8749837.1 terpene cyclase/mutase family protein [Thermalbibacter longus]
MVRCLIGIVLAWALLLVPAVPASANLAPAAALADAVEWLRSQQRPDGGFAGLSGESDPSTTADAIYALVATGIPVESVRAGGKSPLEFLLTQAESYSSTTGGAAKLALAVIAAGADPRQFGGVDLVARIEGAYDTQTGLYDPQLFVNAYALMAIAAATDNMVPQVPPAAIQAVLSRQGPDGSWAWDGSTDPGAGDSNTTAIVIQALIAAGLPRDHQAIAAGLAYLRSAQAADGSFAYQPGVDHLVGDANSTALAVQAILAVGEDPNSSDWRHALDALARFQNPGGALRWRDDAPDDSLLATLQAIPALAGRALPVLDSDVSLVDRARADEIPSSSEHCAYELVTRHNVCDVFRTFWESNGGLANFGYPLTRPYYEPALGTAVQYFERARFELHRGSDGSALVLLGRLGSERAVGRETESPFRLSSPIDRPDCLYFPETGHNLCAGFRAYWESFGGLAVFGYPISEEFNEDGTVVQYFERARFEWHPGVWSERYDVLLSRLGAEVVEAR